jgi:ATP-dependent RNA helicase DHX37/DHR1
MKNVCSVEEKWLPVYLPDQTSFGEPEKEPMARFDCLKDSVVCYRKSTFGPMWPIQAVEVEFPDSLEKYKWFARFLLEGQVCDGFKEYSKNLQMKPSVMQGSFTL